VFKPLFNPERTIRLKARLVIKGFRQTGGTQFTGIAAPIRKYTTLRAFQDCASQQDWKIDQLDVVA
jgi:hypothetical protein